MHTKLRLYIKEPTNCICTTLEGVDDIPIAQVDTFHNNWKEIASRIVTSYNSYGEILSLLDGVKDIVEIFKTESPAQEKWKKEWLQKTRELIAKAEQ